MRRLLSTAIFVAALWHGGSAQAAIIQFVAYLDGLQEVPPVATPGSGDGLLTLDDETGAYTISGNFFDLIGTTTDAHIHGPGDFGVPAGVIHGLTFDVGVTSGAYSGANTFNATQMADLLAGLYYVNIHTTFRPGGEIRGQLTFIPEPASAMLFVVGIATLAAAAWRRMRKC